jgi:probable HAF family extracellular repeat protein
MKRTTKSALIIAVLLSLAVVCLSTPDYFFTYAGSYPGAAETFPNGLNARQTTGYYLQPGGGSFGYIQTNDSFITAQPSGSIDSYLFAVNSAGVAAGGYCLAGAAVCGNLFGEHGYTYDYHTGATTSIDYPGAATTVAYGISDSGTIVGGFCDQDTSGCPLDLFLGSSHAFVDSNGTFSQLDFPGADETTAFAINNAGTVAGTYEINGTTTTVHAFIYQNGQYTDINYPGANWSEAQGINDRGVVVGYYQDANLVVYGFMYSQGQFAQIAVMGNSTAVTGINDHNDLVGTWTNSQGKNLTFKATVLIRSPQDAPK